MIDGARLKVGLLGVILLSFAGYARAASYEVPDVALLYPNERPEELPDLAQLEWAAAELPTMLAQLYAGSAATRRVAVTTEVAERRCLQEARRWKLVAVRLDPFATLALGDVRWLDRRAKDEPTLRHRRVPQLRLTYQPFCFDGRDRAVAADTAIHLLFDAFLTDADAATHRRLWQAMRDAATSGSLGQAGRSAEMRYLAWIAAPERDVDIEALARVSDELSRLRRERQLTGGALSRHLDQVLGADGMIALTPAGRPDGAVSHPLLGSPTSPAATLIARVIRRYGRRETLHQARLMSTGDGQLAWFFSVLEAQAGTPLLVAKPVQVFATETASGRPRLLADLGRYDFQALDASEAYASATPPDRQLMARQNELGDVEASRDAATRAWRHEQELGDPAASGHSTQTCFNCHAAQERATMALRVSEGAGPREFGYFFRAFGYVGELPFLSRRFVNEARATVQALEAWRRHHP